MLVLGTAALLVGCEVSDLTTSDYAFVSAQVTSLNSPDDQEGTEKCYQERFVVPPRGKDKKAPKFRFAEKYKDYVDPDSLGLALNERDVAFSFDTETGRFEFSNPGKSRAVIDVFYCLYLPNNDDGGDGDTGGDGEPSDDGSVDDGQSGDDSGDGSTDESGGGGELPPTDGGYTGAVIIE